MTNKNPSLSDYLRQDFARRRLKNPRFSLRSYARMLSVSPAHLSLILSNQRGIKAASALRISEGLGLTPTEMLQLYRRESGEENEPVRETRYISGEEFSLISHWHCYAILGLAGLRVNVADPRWIAKRLRISSEAAEYAFQCLVENGYLALKDGQFRQIKARVQTQHDVPSAKVRHYHKQTLQLAIEKIDEVEVSMREYVSMTIPVSRSKMKAAKTLIRKFKEDFTAELERGHKNEVYNLCVQFFPLTHVDSREE